MMRTIALLGFGMLFTCGLLGQTPDAREIVSRSNQLMQGNSSYSEITMRIIRPGWERSLSMKAWASGTEYSLIYITAPAREKGQVFLKRNREMWNWIPSIERMIKIPPSMMMQSWMGSDFTNDDLVKESSIVDDYHHKYLGEESIDGEPCHKIELIPLEDAPVVWGKVISWISRNGYMPLRNEFYDEDGYLVNTEHLSEIKNVGDRTIPTRFELIPAEKKGHRTIMVFDNIRFNIPVKDGFFSIQNMKLVR